MKKVISLLTVLFCLLAFSFSAFALSMDYVTCESVSDYTGKTIIVPVNYKSDDGVYTSRVIVTYDTAVLKYLKTEKIATDYFNYTVNEKNGEITIIVDSREATQNVVGDFKLANIHFEITSTAKAGSYELSLSGEASRLNDDGQDLAVEKTTVSFACGKVTVLSAGETKPESNTEEQSGSSTQESGTASDGLQSEENSEEVENPDMISENDEKLVKVAVIIATALALLATVFVIVYIVKNKKNKKEA